MERAGQSDAPPPSRPIRARLHRPLGWTSLECGPTAARARAARVCSSYPTPADLAPGDYELRLLGPTGALLATSNPFSVGASVQVSPPFHDDADAPIVVTWRGLPTPRSTDRLAWYPPLAPDGPPIDWAYLSCTQTPGDAPPAGSCALRPRLAPGTYEVRLLAADGRRLAISNILSIPQP